MAGNGRLQGMWKPLPRISQFVSQKVKTTYDFGRFFLWLVVFSFRRDEGSNESPMGGNDGGREEMIKIKGAVDEHDQ
jgi:hypothetical protein